MNDNAIKKFCVVIQCAKKDYSINLKDLLKSFFSSYPCKYFAIVHDKDFHKDGTLKNKHIHIVLSMASKVRKKTLLNYFCNIFKADIDAISVDKVNNFVSSVQYLFHLNDKDKYQYDFNDCITNCTDELTSIINVKPITQCDFEGDLFNLCLFAPSKIYVVRKIGLAKYSAYARAIDVIFLERENYLKINN